jgi:hypothetical protein
VTAALAVP